MTRTLLVVLIAAGLCLTVTGLRVAMLELAPAAMMQWIAPRTIDDSEPPPAAPPVESIAQRPRQKTHAQSEPSAMLWLPMSRSNRTSQR